MQIFSHESFPMTSLFFRDFEFRRFTFLLLLLLPLSLGVKTDFPFFLGFFSCLEFLSIFPLFFLFL